MNITNLERILSHEPKYRLKQAKEAVFKNLIENWLEAMILPLDLREKLNKECPLEINVIFSSQEKEVIKSRIILEDGLSVETVLMKHSDARNTVCVSSAVGCPLTCAFCATARLSDREAPVKASQSLIRGGRLKERGQADRLPPAAERHV
jgi:adenine C2-methylase RlmN of 23S rRNA A2503 and tRNA A37